MADLLGAAKENLSFLLVCVVVVAVILAVALAAEKLIHRGTKRNMSSARYLTVCGIMSALAAVLMLFELPLFFAPPFYKIDFSEIPVMIGAFSLGPVAGVVIELVKILLKLVIKGTSTAFVGDLANFIIGCSMVVPASVIYYAHKTKKNALMGMITGTLVMTVFGSFFNAVYLLPKFSQLYGLPMDALVEMGTAVNSHINSVSTLVLFAVVPFNILKGVIVTVITMLLYKRISRIIKNTGQR